MNETVEQSVRGGQVGKSQQRRNKEAWRALIACQAASGETIEAFCRSQGVSRSSFVRWRSLLSAVAAAPDVSLHRAARHNVRPVVSEQSARPCFIDAGEIGPGSSGTEPLEIRLEIGRGMVLTIRRG